MERRDSLAVHDKLGHEGLEEKAMAVLHDAPSIISSLNYKYSLDRNYKWIDKTFFRE